MRFPFLSVAVRVLFVLGGAALLAPPAPGAPALPSGFTAVELAPGTTWESPVGIAFLPDGRILVIEKQGLVHLIKNDVVLTTPFLDLQPEVLNNGDRGLLGIAIDPRFATQPYVYFLYTVDPDSDGVDDEGVSFGRVARFRVSASNPDRADPSTRQVLLGATWAEGTPSLSSTHTVGCLRFAPDGTLLITVGEGASASDPPDVGGLQPAGFSAGRFPSSEDIGAFRSQNISSLGGKLLRLDPDTGRGLSSNPYYTGNGADVKSRVWAYGLRNPYRFCVRPGTGSSNPADGRPASIYVGDVGWHDWEEVSVSRARGGENFGWPCREALVLNSDYAAISSPFDCTTLGTSANPANPTSPIIAWHHRTATQSTPPGPVGKAVTGLAFYPGSQYPAAYQGACFLADYNSNWIKFAKVDANDALVSLSDFATDAGGPVDLVADPSNGDIICASLTAKRVYRFRYTGSNRSPVAVAMASPSSGPAPLAVQFSSTGSSDADGDAMTFRWTFGDGDTATGPTATHTYALPGTYQAALTVEDGKGGQDSETIAVSVQGTSPGNAPTATILEPLNEDAFDPAADITLRGSGSDPEDASGSLRFAWQVLLHHNTHVHPDWFFLDGPTGTFTPGNHDDGTGTHFEIRLTVTDTSGLSDMKKVFVFPHSRPLIVEDGAPGTSTTGSWSSSRGPFPHGGRSAFSAGAGDTFTYAVTLPSAGDYKVYAWWTVLESRSTSVPYAIEHAAGTETVRVNQQANGYQWNDLGTYTFDGSARITITSPGGVSTCADAICFLPQSSDAAPVAHIHSISPNPATAGEPVSFSGEGHSDGIITTYRWSSSIDGFLSDQASFISASLSTGVHSISLMVEDSRGATSSAAVATLEVKSNLVERILDNGQPGTTPTGSWPVSAGAGSFGPSSLYAKGTTESYRYQLALPSAGIYEVYAWWTVLESRTTAAPYTIAYATGTQTVKANQLTAGGKWNLLGTYAFGTSGRVTLQSVGNGFSTSADAVRFVLLPNDRIVDEGDPGTTAVGTWSVSGGLGQYGPKSLFAKGSAASYTYSFPAAVPGTYQVFAWWTTLASRSTRAAYRITHANGSITVTVNQRLNGGRWNNLGLYTFNGSGSVQLQALADGDSYSADAIRVRRVSP